MKKLMMLVVPLFLYGLVYYLTDTYYNKRPGNSNTVYIWGDQASVDYLDLQNYHKISGKHALGIIKESTSVFDFLVFSDKVPLNANVIILLSNTTPVYINKLYNGRGSLSPYVIKQLVSLNYPLQNTMSLVSCYLWPDRIFRTLDADETEVNGLKYVPEKQNLWDVQQRLFLQGVKRLIEKNCTISFVESLLPSIKVMIDGDGQQNFKNQILNLFDHYCIDSLKVSVDDESNEIQVAQIPIMQKSSIQMKYLIQKINYQRYPTFYVAY